MSWHVGEPSRGPVAQCLVGVLLAAAVFTVALAVAGCQVVGPSVEGKQFELKFTTSPPVQALPVTPPSTGASSLPLPPQSPDGESSPKGS